MAHALVDPACARHYPRWPACNDNVSPRLAGWRESFGYYLITNTLGFFDVFQAERFSNIPDEIENGARELPVTVKNRTGE